MKILNDIKIKYKANTLSKEFETIITNKSDISQVIQLDESSILSAMEDLQVNFVNYGLIPVFDAFDNDYICYQIHNKKWCMFNTVDEISFNKDSSLQQLLSLKA